MLCGMVVGDVVIQNGKGGIAFGAEVPLVDRCDLTDDVFNMNVDGVEKSRFGTQGALCCGASGNMISDENGHVMESG